MINLDTNLLIRYITRDDKQQWQQATEIIEESDKCLITNIVLCEMIWVLRGEPYKIAKDEILEIIELMIQTPKFEFESRSIVYQALQRTKQGRADFSDYLIGTIGHHIGSTETVTFDQKLRGENGFRCL